MSTRLLRARPRLARRHYSTALTAAVSPRWLSELKQRLGRCITFGLNQEQKQETGRILQEIARDWRELVAGSEGFLTDKYRRSTFRQALAWGNIDQMGHVNNVMYNRFAESARVDWVRKNAKFVDRANVEAWSQLWTPTGEGLLLQRITTEFKFPMKYPDRISVYHQVAEKPIEGTDTFNMRVVILSELHQRPAARLSEQNVLYDYRQAKKIPLRPFMLELLQKTWKLQEESRRVNGKRVQELLQRVRHIETTSWDKEGAVEDMGGVIRSSR